jgi:RNA polymerase sigma factor (sigma-70 family)
MPPADADAPACSVARCGSLAGNDSSANSPAPKQQRTGTPWTLKAAPFPKNLDAPAAPHQYTGRRRDPGMATHRLSKVLKHLQRTLVPPDECALTDGQLLARFAPGGDEGAFAALLRRHGPMVLGVCRRVLRHEQDAEDAYQATFLVLARKASSLRRREGVGSWLYGVAYRTARDARRLRARRAAVERQVDELPHPAVGPEEPQDWRHLLDRELNRLPERLRAPVVLCELEGKSRREAARELGLPEGTLSSRLATARRVLARRLSRPVGAPTPAYLPPALFLSTKKAALLVASGRGAVATVASAQVAALTEGVLKTMFLAKLKTVAVVVVCGVAALGLGTGGVLYQARAGAPGDPQAQAAAQPQKDKDPTRAADEVRSLREQLEEARRQIADLKAEADRLRQQAEEAQRRAKEELAKASDAQDLARREAARKIQPGNVYLPSRGKARNTSAADMDEGEARVKKEFDAARRALEQQLKELDAKEKEALAVLKDKRKTTQLAAPTGDKLDQVLERLERLEKRLDKLERE